MNRISLSGGMFRVIRDGKEVWATEDTIKFVVVNAAKVSRSYYAGLFDSNNPTAPTCWSADTTQPSPEVPEHVRADSHSV